MNEPSERRTTWSASWAHSKLTSPRTRSLSTSVPWRGISRRTTALRPSASKRARSSGVRAAKRRLYWDWRFSAAAALRSASVSAAGSWCRGAAGGGASAGPPLGARRHGEVLLFGPQRVARRHRHAELVDAEHVGRQAQRGAQAVHGLGDERVEHDHQGLEHVEGGEEGVAA